MSKVIYAVVSGYYSDYTVNGYCTTRELAEKYCALRNKGVDDSYRAEELECFDDVGSQVEKIWFVYCFSFERLKSGWRVTPISSDNYSTDHCHREPDISDRRFIRQYPGHDSNNIWVKVWVDKQDIEKARKIAIDAFYMWRADEALQSSTVKEE